MKTYEEFTKKVSDLPVPGADSRDDYARHVLRDLVIDAKEIVSGNQPASDIIEPIKHPEPVKKW